MQNHRDAGLLIELDGAPDARRGDGIGLHIPSEAIGLNGEGVRRQEDGGVIATPEGLDGIGEHQSRLAHQRVVEPRNRTGDTVRFWSLRVH